MTAATTTRVCLRCAQPVVPCHHTPLKNQCGWDHAGIQTAGPCAGLGGAVDTIDQIPGGVPITDTCPRCAAIVRPVGIPYAEARFDGAGYYLIVGRGAARAYAAHYQREHHVPVLIDVCPSCGYVTRTSTGDGDAPPATWHYMDRVSS